MRILAPFDQTYTSQSAIPLLAQLAGMSSAEVEVTLVSVLHAPIGIAPQRSRRDQVPIPPYVEVLPVELPVFEIRDGELISAVAERGLGQLHSYLLEIARRLPPGTRVNTEAHISDRPRQVITECARYRDVDLIVMATRSHPRGSSLLFGSTTEAIIDSGVAPTLVVHPGEGDAVDATNVEMRLTRRARIALTSSWLR